MYFNLIKMSKLDLFILNDTFSVSSKEPFVVSEIEYFNDSLVIYRGKIYIRLIMTNTFVAAYTIESNFIRAEMLKGFLICYYECKTVIKLLPPNELKVFIINHKCDYLTINSNFIATINDNEVKVFDYHKRVTLITFTIKSNRTILHHRFHSLNIYHLYTERDNIGKDYTFNCKSLELSKHYSTLKYKQESEIKVCVNPYDYVYYTFKGIILPIEVTDITHYEKLHDDLYLLTFRDSYCYIDITNRNYIISDHLMDINIQLSIPRKRYGKKPV